MLCACSGEQFRFEEPPPRSPESLVTRDFSGVSRASSRTTRNFSASGLFSRIASGGGDHLASKLDHDQVDEAESTLKGSLGLNYEEARALLGRMEYQKGNFSGAIQLFQGIDIGRLMPEMIKAIREHGKQKENKSKANGVMSMPSVSLFLEAILLKSKTLKELGRVIDAANECKMIEDIVESALPGGILERNSQDGKKMQEMFHKALELLPELWKHAGRFDEAILSYRRALVTPWNLSPARLASVQRDLASILLYGGVETTQTSQISNLEEAILLLFILVSKMLNQEIEWDQEITDHLTYGLSICGGFEFLADHFEQVLPGIYDRSERWYILALCYSACGQNEVALNLLKKVAGKSEMNKQIPNLHSFLLGAKLSTLDPKHADEGIDFAQRFIDLSTTDECGHFIAQAHKFLGICYGNKARESLSSFERERCQKESLKSLNDAFLLDNKDPELLINLGMENAIQRNLNAAFDHTMLHSDVVAESSGKGWKLLALILSAQHRFSDVETILELASIEAEDMDHLELLRLKAALQTSQEQPRQAIETYGSLLSQIQPWKRCKSMKSPLKDLTSLEVEAWHHLTEIYAHQEAWCNAEACVYRAKSIEAFDPRSWHAEGLLMQAKAQYQEALVAFSMSLSMEPEHAPSLISMAKVIMELGSNSLPIARSLLMNALQIDPTNHDAWFNLGLISKREGLASQACDYFQAAHELDSSAPIQPFL